MLNYFANAKLLCTIRGATVISTSALKYYRTVDMKKRRAFKRLRFDYELQLKRKTETGKVQVIKDNKIVSSELDTLVKGAQHELFVSHVTSHNLYDFIHCIPGPNNCAVNCTLPYLRRYCIKLKR